MSSLVQEHGLPGDYLVQNDSGDQWTIEGRVFNGIYEKDTDKHHKGGDTRITGVEGERKVLERKESKTEHGTGAAHARRPSLAGISETD